MSAVLVEKAIADAGLSVRESPGSLVIVERSSPPVVDSKPEPTEAEKTALAESELAWMFPEVDCGVLPFGTRVVVQIRRTKTKSAGGIVLPEETKETEKWNQQVAKVVAFGSLCYRNRETRELWPEGMWASLGDFVRIPRWGGDRWEVPVVGQDDPALFCTFIDHELISKITGNPALVRSYIL